MESAEGPCDLLVTCTQIFRFLFFFVFCLYSEIDSIPTKLLIIPLLFMQLCAYSDDCSLKQSVWTNSPSFPSCSSAEPQSRRSRCVTPFLQLFLLVLLPATHENRLCRRQVMQQNSKTAAKPQSSNLLLPIDLPVYISKGHLTNVDISHIACLEISKLGNLEIFQKTQAECAVYMTCII